MRTKVIKKSNWRCLWFFEDDENLSIKSLNRDEKEATVFPRERLPSTTSLESDIWGIFGELAASWELSGVSAISTCRSESTWPFSMVHVVRISSVMWECRDRKWILGNQLMHCMYKELSIVWPCFSMFFCFNNSCAWKKGKYAKSWMDGQTLI